MRIFKTTTFILIFHLLLSLGITSDVLAAKARPDLVVTSISASVLAADRGQSFTVTERVENQGVKTAGKSSTRYYLSKDINKDSKDILLANKRSMSRLASAWYDQGSTTVIVPKKTPFGNYYLIACADALKKVKESNENNNCMASGSTIKVIPSEAATPAGSPVGSAATKTIGSAGGTLTSPDSMLTISIPASALTESTVISIQPITNNAHGGIGSGYRLTPDSQTFQQPVSLTFTYTDQDLIGSAVEALGMAYQSSDGYWNWMNNPVVDTTARTVSVTTDHFTDFATVAEGYVINPLAATVHVGKTVTLMVQQTFIADGEELAPLPVKANKWEVNGVSGGNSKLGTISSNGLYHAPATKPTPNTVTVSARVNASNNKVIILVANITIIDNNIYTGTVQFAMTTGISGSANVTWTKFEDLGDVRRYLPTGSITADIDIQNCEHLHVSNVPIETGTTTNPKGTLVVYTSTNAAYPKQHQFAIAADGNVQLCCGTPTCVPVTVPANSVISFYGGACGLPPFASFTDEDILTGTTNCPEYGLSSSSWTFTAQ